MSHDPRDSDGERLNLIHVGRHVLDRLSDNQTQNKVRLFLSVKDYRSVVAFTLDSPVGLPRSGKDQG